MVLTIFVVWLVLAALAVFFMYCCSRVSEGPRRKNRDSGPTGKAPIRVTAATRAHPI
jgi:hypothetical protein